jgi:membrane-bound metal-dependent hydrolase YbcI (DUF457 family)
MADLVTHAAVGYLIARPLRDPKARALVMAGTALPDLLYKGIVWGTGSSTWYAEPTHSPVGLIFWCGLLAMFFAPPLRRCAFWGLLAGGATHLLVDAGKDYLGHGVILWAFPFSFDRVELGWYTNQDAFVMVPAALALMAITELACRRRRPPPATRST